MKAYVLAEGNDEVEMIKNTVKDELGEINIRIFNEVYYDYEDPISIYGYFVKYLYNEKYHIIMEYTDNLWILLTSQDSTISLLSRVPNEVIDARISLYEKEFRTFLKGIKFAFELIGNLFYTRLYNVNKEIANFLDFIRLR